MMTPRLLRTTPVIDGRDRLRGFDADFRGEQRRMTLPMSSTIVPGAVIGGAIANFGG